MRCLHETGYLNFRMRALTVSFFTHILWQPWQEATTHLSQMFLDFEPGIHFPQLQMQAGIVGINTVRVYSPTKQIADQDPECQFIKQWIPELRDFTVAEIMSYETCPLGQYPRPIVDFKAQSKQMKDQIFTIRKSLEGQTQSAKVLKAHGSRKGKGKAKPAQPKPQATLF